MCENRNFVVSVNICTHSICTIPHPIFLDRMTLITIHQKSVCACVCVGRGGGHTHLNRHYNFFSINLLSQALDLKSTTYLVLFAWDHSFYILNS